MTAPARDRSKLARAALAYATEGWAIVPLHSAPGGVCSCARPTCESQGKHPRTNRGFQDASADPTIVASWWDRWPDANIGFRPGPAGLLVVDVDGPDGEQAAQTLGLLAEPTLEVVTGRADGGRHRYYTHPGGTIANVVLAPKLDVRADHGYVLLPPSVHKTGRVYRWAGTLRDVGELPPAVIARLSGGAPAGTSPPAADQLPAWMIPWLTVAEGQRNQTLTRFVGWAFAQGHAAATVMAMALGVSAAWPDPLGRDEVEATVKSIAVCEARKGRSRRVTVTGTELALAADAPADAPAPVLPADLAHAQAASALARGRRDLSDAPRWGCRDLDRVVGAMIPGDLVVVGSLSGNGKTSFLLSQMDYLASHRVPTLYLPLEVDPVDIRRKWAAWKLRLDFVHVARNEWHLLPEGAQEAHEGMLEEQGRNPYVQFPPDRRVTVRGLEQWVQWAIEHMGVRCVMVDHLHRMDFGGGDQYRIQVTEAMRAMKDLAREHGLVLIAAAQLNQHGDDVMDRYFPPALRRLKESAGIGEEADVVLMLSRRLKIVLDAADLRAVRAGLKSEREFAEPNTMAVTCRKHRLADSIAGDRTVLLQVEDGRVSDRAPDWREHLYGN